MCGIVGAVSNSSNGFTIKEFDVFSQMLFLDTVRGFDSTGVFGISTKGNVDIHKAALHGLDFINTAEYRKFRTDMVANGKFVIGHNRAATRGTVEDKNAHPFWVDDKIILVQNGTYKGDHTHLKNTEVDTEAVAHVISETPDVSEALQKINASYALVWYNADDKTLNLIRNSERPLFIAEFYGTGIFFASEKDFIEYSAKRAGVVLKAEPVSLPEHTHVVLTLDEKGGYTRTDTKLDASFRFQGKTVFTDVGWETTRTHTPTQLAVAYSGSNRSNGKRDDVESTFADSVGRTHHNYFFTSKADAIADIDLVTAAAHAGCHYVEMIDYLPANRHPHCTAWHVFGVVLTPDIDTSKPTTLVHWIVYGAEESEVMEKYFAGFFKVRLSTIISRTMTQGNTVKYLNTVYASTHEEIIAQPTTSN